MSEGRRKRRRTRRRRLGKIDMESTNLQKGRQEVLRHPSR
jgi:hypothetical protein